MRVCMHVPVCACTCVCVREASVLFADTWSLSCRLAGGGAVRVQWADGARGLSALFTDVVFVNNTVVGVFNATGPTGQSSVDTGGAALVVTGRVSDSAVGLQVVPSSHCVTPTPFHLH
jgi:hypothetical protein